MALAGRHRRKHQRRRAPPHQFRPDITQITEDHDWMAIAIGEDYNVNYSFALKRNGTVWGWGPNIFDAPWNIDRKSLNLTPRQIDPGTNWIAISFGHRALFALKVDGTLWICDRNRDEGRTNYATSSLASEGSGIFTQLDQGHNWRRINGFGSDLIAVKSDGTYWFFGDYRVGFLGLGKVPSGEAKSFLPCEVEPWAFCEDGATTLLLARDGTLWSLGEHIGYDMTTLMNVQNTGHRVLGDRWPGSWVFQKFVLDQAPKKIWKLPTARGHSLDHPSKVDAQEFKHPSP